ncbi:hypothetical protein H0O02_00475 [Candidatus Micrarchaeota archaeon]|nr:hypothetical protein [Candidatus Micrarchaeota archaeon]
MSGEFGRTFGYALDFYLQKVAIVALFSIPFLVAVLIAWLVAAPTYLAAGALFIRTGSIPELSALDIALSVIGYAIIMFIISDTIVNITILVRSRRTLNETTSEMLAAMKHHATRIFYILTIAVLVEFLLQLLLYDNPLRTWIYPIAMLIFFFFVSFSMPAVVIDNASTAHAIEYSIRFAMRKPILVILWMLTLFILLGGTMVLSYYILSAPFWIYLVLLLNSIVFLPFMLILQTQLYMEKYPLAR